MSDDDHAHRTDHDRLRWTVWLPADPGRVWAEIGGLASPADWHPLVEAVTPEEIEGDPYRYVTLAEGGVIFERVVETGPHHLTTEAVESPFPVADLRFTLSVVAEETGCHVFWSAYFVPADDAGAHMPDRIVARYVESGLEALAERFGG